MNRIWKWPLVIADEQYVQVPSGGKFLAVQTQYGLPQLWALVDDAEPTVRYRINVHGTGHPVSARAEDYVGTFQLSNGDLVFHVFAGAA